MNFFKKLLGQEETRTDWDITPAEQRPARRDSTAVNEAPPAVRQPKGDHPFLDDAALDSMNLEADKAPADNPYHHFNRDDELENDTRKMKTIQISDSSDALPGDAYNPYDTGSMRRSWKK